MTLTPRGRAVRRFTIACLLGLAIGLSLTGGMTAATYLLRVFCCVVLVVIAVGVVDRVVAWADRRAIARERTKSQLRAVDSYGRGHVRVRGD